MTPPRERRRTHALAVRRGQSFEGYRRGVTLSRLSVLKPTNARGWRVTATRRGPLWLSSRAEGPLRRTPRPSCRRPRSRPGRRGAFGPRALRRCAPRGGRSRRRPGRGELARSARRAPRWRRRGGARGPLRAQAWRGLGVRRGTCLSRGQPRVARCGHALVSLPRGLHGARDHVCWSSRGAPRLRPSRRRVGDLPLA